MPLSEKQIENRMSKMIHDRGGLCYKFISPGTAGVPDRIVILPDGSTIYVELKTKVGRMASIQRWQIGRMRGKGAEVRELYGWDAVKEFIDEVLPTSRKEVV